MLNYNKVTKEIKQIEDNLERSKTYEITIRVAWAGNGYKIKTIKTVQEDEKKGIIKDLTWLRLLWHFQFPYF